MGKLPEPKECSIFYEDDRVYACLAFEPIVEGHTIVAWKREHREDISELSMLP
jgi:diadenosine tetraphosphate (Ap4A) HIT family hydrolase